MGMGMLLSEPWRRPLRVPDPLLNYSAAYYPSYYGAYSSPYYGYGYGYSRLGYYY